MKLAYISGPYRAETPHGIVENIRNAEAVAIELWRMGYAVICPHKNTALLDGACDDDVWLEGDLEMLRRCDVVVVLPKWVESEGTMDEIEEAMLNDIPRRYWPDDAGVLIREAHD